MQLTQITPFIPCSLLSRQIGFYRDCLGFTLGYQAENYAFLHRDAAALRLVQVDPDVDLKKPDRQGSFYIDVRGLDALYESLLPALAALPEGRVRPPFDQAYGQREFYVADEDCTLALFGEHVGRASG
jgi:catechol 2,3-dioxygenase-like lactoylglutathione lyase family enzyme